MYGEREDGRESELRGRNRVATLYERHACVKQLCRLRLSPKRFFANAKSDGLDSPSPFRSVFTLHLNLLGGLRPGGERGTCAEFAPLPLPRHSIYADLKRTLARPTSSRCVRPSFRPSADRRLRHSQGNHRVWLHLPHCPRPGLLETSKRG